MIAGIGCRRDATAAQVLAAVDAALAQHGRSREAVEAIAVLPAKAGEAGIVEAARVLHVPLRVVAARSSVETPTASAASRKATGQGSASEAAALVAAGAGASLLGSRTATGAATCALAERRRP